MAERIGVVGLGYVGLPVALAFAKHFPDTVGFDRDRAKVERLRAGFDHTGEVSQAELANSSLLVTADASLLLGCSFFVVAVPTPVDADNRPDLRALLLATETVGHYLKPGAIVVYESTVYPGVTEELCGPVLARTSGLTAGRDFKLGYSPERINPGDLEHTLERIVKVVSGEDAQALDRIAAAYGRIVAAGVHRAPSIKVAEAAKVIENTQRDLNIALMNELSLIFDRMHIRTSDVLAAAKTKWNFLPFTPGLVGGHCIGVDPYYLTTKAAQLGYEPQVILAGRKINNSMAAHVAQRTVKLLVNANLAARGARVGVLGLTFKEDVSDIRNSKVPDIVRELKEFGVEVLVADPIADEHEVEAEYGLAMSPLGQLKELDALIVAVPHRQFRSEPPKFFLDRLKVGGVLVDIKHLIPPGAVPAERAHYWSL